MKELSVSHAPYAIITDNCSVMKCAFENIVSDAIYEENEESAEPNFTVDGVDISTVRTGEAAEINWNGCAANLLQLVVKDGMEEALAYSRLQKCIAKCKAIARLYKQSPSFATKLTDHVHQSIEVRWNSTLKIIDSILKQLTTVNECHIGGMW
jgi:hypothetical protein